MKRQALLATLVGSAIALAAPLTASAQTNRYSSIGMIASVNGSSFTLDNGTTVFMHHGTVINPTGVTLYPGMRVHIMGVRDGRGHFDANQVDVTGAKGHYRRYH